MHNKNLQYCVWIGSSPVFGSFELRLLPMFVKYLINCSTLSFLSVMLVPSEVVNLSFTIIYAFCFSILILHLLYSTFSCNPFYTTQIYF